MYNTDISSTLEFFVKVNQNSMKIIVPLKRLVLKVLFLYHTGVTFRQGEMLGFQTTAGVPSCTAKIGLPIPVHQLNSYLMQQGSVLNPRGNPRPNRKQEREVSLHALIFVA